MFLIFVCPAYLLLTLSGMLSQGLCLLLSPVLGIVVVTTAYDLCVRVSLLPYFLVVLGLLAAAGLIALGLRVRRGPVPWTVECIRTAVAGSLTALALAPLYWTSGRFSGSEFVFHGPAGEDPLFHVTLLQRLLQHVPPDNFMFAGLRPTVYHYFDDQALALVLRAQEVLHFGSSDRFDLYFRCYPTLVYFMIGALAYLAGRQLVGTAKGGILGVLLLLGGGGLGWVIGILQTLAHATHFVAMRERLFLPWTSWDGMDGIHPLVHRPAHYNGLLISLAAINILLRPERTRRHWCLAGLLLGLMAGFNFTMAATFGAAAVVATLLTWLWHKKNDAHDLACMALFIFLGSLPVNLEMFLSGFHNYAAGFPFRGPNLEYSTSVWGPAVGRILPPALLPIACLMLLPIMAYGIKVCGVRALVKLDLGHEHHRGLALCLAVAFLISFAVGTFFPYRGLPQPFIFLQPTMLILGLFSLRAISAWVEHKQTNWRSMALWGVLALTWVQVLLAFNFSFKETIGQDSVSALQDVRATASPDDVVAYLPSDIEQKGVWSYAQQSTNFSIMAMTGLDGYFSSKPYSEFNAVPGLKGNSSAEILAKADRLYEQRQADVDSFIRGEFSTAASARLAADHVRWIVVSGDAMREISSPRVPWRRTRDIVIYELGEH